MVMMNTLRLVRVVSAGLLVTLALPAAGAGKSPARKTAASSVVKTLVQMEQDWSQAGMTGDSRTMDRIMAEDWVSVDFEGRTVTKAQAMVGLKIAASAAQPVELGDMKVRVFGTTAIVQGKDSTGQYAWMDVFLKRDGKWQAVASQSTRIVK